VNLDIVRLDPFSEDTIKLFLQTMTISIGKLFCKCFFPTIQKDLNGFFNKYVIILEV